MQLQGSANCMALAGKSYVRGSFCNESFNFNVNAIGDMGEVGEVGFHHWLLS